MTTDSTRHGSRLHISAQRQPENEAQVEGRRSTRNSSNFTKFFMAAATLMSASMITPSAMGQNQRSQTPHPRGRHHSNTQSDPQHAPGHTGASDYAGHSEVLTPSPLSPGTLAVRSTPVESVVPEPIVEIRQRATAIMSFSLTAYGTTRCNPEERICLLAFGSRLGFEQLEQEYSVTLPGARNPDVYMGHGTAKTAGISTITGFPIWGRRVGLLQIDLSLRQLITELPEVTVTHDGRSHRVRSGQMTSTTIGPTSIIFSAALPEHGLRAGFYLRGMGITMYTPESYMGYITASYSIPANGSRTLQEVYLTIFGMMVDDQLGAVGEVAYRLTHNLSRRVSMIVEPGVAVDYLAARARYNGRTEIEGFVIGCLSIHGITNICGRVGTATDIQTMDTLMYGSITPIVYF